MLALNTWTSKYLDVFQKCPHPREKRKSVLYLTMVECFVFFFERVLHLAILRTCSWLSIWGSLLPGLKSSWEILGIKVGSSASKGSTLLIVLSSSLLVLSKSLSEDLVSSLMLIEPLVIFFSFWVLSLVGDYATFWFLLAVTVREFGGIIWTILWLN